MRGSLVKHALVFRDDIIHDRYDWDGYARLMYLKLRQAIAGCLFGVGNYAAFFSTVLYERWKFVSLWKL